MDMKHSAVQSIPWPDPLPPAAAPALAVIETLTTAGYEAYLVGGAVRDLILDHPPGDFDVATSATPETIAELFPATEAVGATFGVMLVIQDGTAVETATFRTESTYSDGRHPDQVTLTASMVEDAQRRDFTVNALFLDPIDGRILDPTSGLADCHTRILRTVGDPGDRIREDALRLLRAPRLAAQCDLTIAPDTLTALTQLKELIGNVSAERVGKEISLLLTGPDPACGLESMTTTGLLDIILPEVAAMQGVPQPEVFHPEGDVWIHTLLMFRHSDSRSLALGLGILLHDVGKPPTISYEDRIRFNGHTKHGEEMTVAIGRRLRLARKVVELSADLVAQHMRFLDVRNMRPATLKRFLRQDHFPELLELHRLDCVASHGDLSNYEFCRRSLATLATEDLRPEPLLRGSDLLALGYAEGPWMGAILRDLETAQLEGAVRTQQEAETWLRRTHPLPTGEDS